ncbi:type II secretion system protein GspL [Rhizorhabdus dicambivorans]|uniref:General secretion pathway protein GspL n=1 Tax=Rhizorhabdus dicambivorans TaxID=1850238 RepID=A0A2A4FVJ0_9SPHN|nr:type II secretion system protein GspL [Rhizorhabdus dicambivorans]ATE63535.1 general secretion pathway protein GspL [Rhizorhabdus dicambivorans]PCE41411.1 general secretion pathway protein GspL [Rhizorhabdus dicambivorans]
MKLMLQSPSIAPAFARIKNALADRAAGGVWMLDGGVPHAIAASAARDLLLVPAEQVLVLGAALPLPSRAKRIAALPFAIEDRIAARADQVHLALGAQGPGGEWLAGVVDPALMAGWVAEAEAAGLGDATIMPDALALPLPEPGCWSVHRIGARILARLPDGTGFAAMEPLFLSIWAAAGRPECDEAGFGDAAIPIALDLRQGIFARPRQGLSRTARRVALVAAGGLLAHGAIATADTFALRSIAAKRGAELTAQLNASAPGRFTGSDPHEAAAVAAEILPAGGTAPPGALLPLLTRASAALAPFGGAVTVRAMRFDEAGRSLRFDCDSADPGAARGIVDALRQAGLNGRFEGDSLIVTGGAA